MSKKKKLQRELIRTLVQAGNIIFQLVGVHVGEHLKSGAPKKRIVRVVLKAIVGILLALAVGHISGTSSW